MAFFLFAGGTTGLLIQVRLWFRLAEQWLIGIRTSQIPIVLGNTVIMVFLTCITAAATLGGIFLWRRTRHGTWLSLAALTSQVLVIVVPGFQYRVWMLGLVGFGLSDQRLGTFFTAGTEMFIEFEPHGFAIIVNIPVALLATALLTVRPRQGGRG